MNRLIWKLLRHHISKSQLCGFFLASLAGMTIVLLGIQFYQDVAPVFTGDDSFLKKNYIVATRKISTLGFLAGTGDTFSTKDIDDLRHQPFAQSVGVFTPSLFNVSAGVGMEHAGIRLSTEMFFEAVPDKYMDISLNLWHFDVTSGVIPIVIPRNYLNLYNFGFAKSRGLPRLSEGLINLVRMNIRLSGNGLREEFKGQIIGFSNRLNTILVPQTFMDWANARYAPGHKPRPSRLIVEVNNPADPAISRYFHEKGYETEGNALDTGQATYFLRIVTSVVIGVGLIICLLAFYILMLSIFLLLQKNKEKLRNLLLIGYSPRQVGMPYYLLSAGLNLTVWVLATGCVTLIQGTYLHFLEQFIPGFSGTSPLLCLFIGFVLAFFITLFNAWSIRKQIGKLL